MPVVEGTVLRGREFDPVEGRVVIADGKITAIEEESVDSDHVILPAFVNAHTHIGDSIAKDAGAGLSLEELVAPPDGLKHQLLRQADRESLVDAMRTSIRFMHQTGTGAFVEFREGGVAGIEAIEAAHTGSGVEAVVLGRETVEAMECADGFGASGANDADFTDERAATREAGKLFGIHAGEVNASDIDPGLDLEPDFVVHMVHANEDHLDRVAQSGVPVVVCPRSNLATNVGFPPIEALVERTTVALGTDNVFVNSPSMFRELEFAAKLTDLDDRELLRMATVSGAELAGLNCGVIEPGRDGRLVVLDGDSDNLSGSRDLVRSVVRRAGATDVVRTV